MEGNPPVLLTLLLDNEDWFVQKLPGLPHGLEVFRTIPTEEGHRPPCTPAYCLAHHELKQCERTIAELLSLGLVRPHCSPFAFAITFGREKRWFIQDGNRLPSPEQGHDLVHPIPSIPIG